MTSDPFKVGFTRDYLTEGGELAYGDIGLALFDQAPMVEYRFLDKYEDVVTPEQIQDLNGLSLIYPHISARTFSNGADRLIVIGRCGVGYDRIDLESCTENNVALVNAPDAMRFPAASAALMFLLALCKRLPDMDRLVRTGRWDLRSVIQGIEPRGKTLGIIGLGTIGGELARLIAPFEMRILAFDPYADADRAFALGVELTSLERLMRDSDFVSLHCPLNDETRDLIGERELTWMKPTAYLINMARGPVVNHRALVDCLTKREIAGAGLDVFFQEPLPADDPLIDLDNVILTPHWAAGTLDVFHDAGVSNIKAMLQASQGELPDNIVNRDVIKREGFRSKLARFKT